MTDLGSSEHVLKSLRRHPPAVDENAKALLSGILADYLGKIAEHRNQIFIVEENAVDVR